MKKLNAAIFITGLSSAGKTTLAYKLIEKLKNIKVNTLLLDGTEMYASSILYPFKGHEPEQRESRSMHLTRIINWVSDQGILPIIPIVGQPINIRDQWRIEIKDYVEIFLDCEIDLCMKRDNKDLYNSLKKGKTRSVIGVDRVFNKPQNPWLTIDSGKYNKDEVFNLAWERVSKIDWLSNFKNN